MGIVVCFAMLLGLTMLRPSPFNAKHHVLFNPECRRVVWIALAGLGAWNVLHGLFNASGFWCFMSIFSGVVMILAAGMVAGDQTANVAPERTAAQNTIIVVLALSFLVYAVTLIQLNLGYAILR